MKTIDDLLEHAINEFVWEIPEVPKLDRINYSIFEHDSVLSRRKLIREGKIENPNRWIVPYTYCHVIDIVFNDGSTEEERIVEGLRNGHSKLHLSSGQTILNVNFLFNRYVKDVKEEIV